MNLRTFKNGTAARTRHPGGRYVQDAAKSEEATIYVYDEISWFGINANDFAKTLALVPDSVKTLHVRINSPGGDVFDAHAMATLLRQHSAHVVTHTDGLAASAASYLALSGDEVRISDSAFLMIHDPWTIAMGSAADFRKTANTLDQIGEGIANEYAKRSNASREQIDAWMKEETWFNAEDALQHGFVDYIDGAETEAKNTFDLSVFAKVPDALKFAAQMEDGGTGTIAGRHQRDVEQILRNEGCSRSLARRAALALSKPVLGQCEADENADAVRDSITRLIATMSTPRQLHHERADRAA